jgi:iron complex outermembrane recepter protein
MRKLLLVLVLLLYIPGLYSQETKLDTIVLSGIRADKKTPVSQKTITKQEIQKIYSGQEIPILLNNTPSITSSTDGGHSQGYTYFRLRGIDQTRINMTLNGVPLNEPEDQGVYFSNYPNFAKSINSLQIQRGVGTSTNGVSAYAGSINFTSNFGEQKYTELEIEGGSFGTQRSSFTYSSGFSKNGKFSGFINVSQFYTDGYKYSSGSKGNSIFLGGSYYTDIGTFKVTGFSGRINNEMAWFAVSEDDIKIDPRTNYNDAEDDDNFDQSLIMVEYSKRFNSKNSLSTTVFYNRLNGEWDLNVGDKLNFRLHSNFYGVIGNYNLKGNNTDYNFGISANKYDRNHSMVILPDSDFERYNNTGFKNEMSTYIKGKFDIDKFTLFGDLQLRNSTFTYNGDVPMENQEWTFFNPKAGITYNVNNNTNYYVSVGKSEREPTRLNLFGEYDEGVLVSAADNLVELINIKPEKVIDYELGINYKSPNFILQGNIYYMDFSNEIVPVGEISPNGFQRAGNVDQSYRSGIEIDMTYNPYKFVTLQYNSNFSDNKIKDSGIEFEPLYTPKMVNNLSINVHNNKSFIEIAVKHHSSSYLDFANENVTPAFAILNASSGTELGDFKFKVKLDNIFNKEYFTNGYMDGGVRNFYVNAPLSIFCTVTYTF